MDKAWKGLSICNRLLYTIGPKRPLDIRVTYISFIWNRDTVYKDVEAKQCHRLNGIKTTD